MPFRRRMRSLPLSSVRITDPFWSKWQDTVSGTTLLHIHKQLEETGRLENFRKVVRGESGTHKGLKFDDSDVYKWLEACAYSLAIRPNHEVGKAAREAIDLIAQAQEADGYINTFFQLNYPQYKWANLSAMHEMYCIGHLIEACVAMAQYHSDEALLNVGIKAADHVLSIFGPEGRLGFCGHEEIELAFIKLSNITGDPKYRERARWMVDMRGQRPSPFETELDTGATNALAPWLAGFMNADGKYSGEYAQDHAPVREHDKVVGHAVRAMYLYIAAADLADGQNDQALEDALTRAWTNLTKRRMYVTGGIGPSGSNEGFTTDYDLPNLSSYAETCAAIGLFLWGHAMLEQTGEGDYADVMELALYNGLLSGISLSGDRFFYANPHESHGTHQRVPWFTCACCPPNIARVLANLGSYALGAYGFEERGLGVPPKRHTGVSPVDSDIHDRDGHGTHGRDAHSTSDKTVWIHLPIAMQAEVAPGLKIEIVGDYPRSGEVEVKVDPTEGMEFVVKVRIPLWCGNVEVEGLDEEADYDGNYILIRRRWKPGDTFRVNFDVQPKWVRCNPKVAANLGRVALMRGPVVYCLQSGAEDRTPLLAKVNTDTEIAERPSQSFNGSVMLSAPGFRDADWEDEELYLDSEPESESAEFEFIPYYAWCNPGPNTMAVWVRER
ncbi:MAG: glycoside hydrolase family 127 protein [Fimbriimonadaceae bacterium]|nr:glycoside hydrolase family 127 protein [Fimbriimonadaceae bacterium]